jgi:hypothetical protein
MRPPPKHSPAEIAFIKAELVARVRTGSTLRAIRQQLGNLSSCTVHMWFATDDDFHRAYRAAVAERRELLGRDPRGRQPDWTAEEVAHLKRNVVRLVGEEFLTVRDALKRVGVSYSLLRKWAQADPAFDQAMKEAVEDLTEHEADRLKDLHVELLDAKMASVAGNHLKTWLGLRNARMRPQAEPDDGRGQQLAEILRSAVHRLIDHVAPASSSASAMTIASERRPAIDVTPRRIPFRRDNGPPLEGT